MKIVESRKNFFDNENQPKFSQLFKFYKLKSGFKTFSQLAHELELKGFYYDLSLYSHWQRGSRVPKNRELLLNLIEIFSNAGGMKFQEQADTFLQSAKNNTLYISEKEKLPPLKNNQTSTPVKLELNKFIASEKAREKSKCELANLKKRNYKYSFLLTSEIFLYLKKTSENKCTSKANFLRKLLEDHRKFNCKTKICV